jgi:uncharacterized membrane protein YdjX (TVP38/TMEM64 family)
MNSARIRHILGYAWVALVVAIFSLYLFDAPLFHAAMQKILHVPIIWAYVIFFALGCLRGFTLIPSTYFILLGFLFFPPWPLYFLVVISIVISAASVYQFSHLLQLDEYFERKYPRHIASLRSALEKYELPIIIGWSFSPFLPTDIICYVCGTLGVDFKKFVFGVFIGEAISCIFYVFGGYLLFAACVAHGWCTV